MEQDDWKMLWIQGLSTEWEDGCVGLIDLEKYLFR